LALAVWNDEIPLIESILRSLYPSGVSSIRASSEKRILFSYPDDSEWEHCALVSSSTLNRYGVKLGKIEGCLSLRALFARSLFSSTFLILFLFSTFLLAIVSGF